MLLTAYYPQWWAALFCWLLFVLTLPTAVLAAHRVHTGKRCHACKCPSCSQGRRCLCICTGGDPYAAPSRLQEETQNMRNTAVSLQDTSRQQVSTVGCLCQTAGVDRSVQQWGRGCYFCCVLVWVAGM
jgi:hypothetical protein